MDIARDREVQLEREKGSYLRMHQSEMARLTEYERDMSYLEQDISNLEGFIAHFEKTGPRNWSVTLRHTRLCRPPMVVGFARMLKSLISRRG